MASFGGMVPKNSLFPHHEYVSFQQTFIFFRSIDDNARSNEIFATTPVIVSENGNMLWLTPVVANVFCYMDIEAFPFDQQQVTMTVASWAHGEDEIKVIPRKNANDSSAFIGNGGWELEYFDLDQTRSFNDTLTGIERSVVIFRLGLSRRPLFYLYYTALPCMIIVYIAIQVFCLPPESGEKMTLAITMVLSMTVFLLMVAETTPPSSLVIPIIGKSHQLCQVTLSLATKERYTSKPYGVP